MKALDRLRNAIEARERAYAIHREACKAVPFDSERAAKAEQDWTENVRKVEEEMWDALKAREA